MKYKSMQITLRPWAGSNLPGGQLTCPTREASSTSTSVRSDGALLLIVLGRAIFESKMATGGIVQSSQLLLPLRVFLRAKAPAADAVATSVTS